MPADESSCSRFAGCECNGAFLGDVWSGCVEARSEQTAVVVCGGVGTELE